MRNILLILPLIFVVSCGESFEDEFLLCSQTAYKVATKDEGAKVYETEESTWRYMHTQDAFIVLDATPPRAYPFIKKDEQGYRYFEQKSSLLGGKVDSPVTFKYHPVFRDMESTNLSLTHWDTCTKAG